MPAPVTPAIAPNVCAGIMCAVRGTISLCANGSEALMSFSANHARILLWCSGISEPLEPGHSSCQLMIITYHLRADSSA